MIINCGGKGGDSGDVAALDYSYSGTSEITGNIYGDWCITLKSAGTFIFNNLGNAAQGIEVCCVGAGGGGCSGYDNAIGGGGGEGGQVVNQTVSVEVGTPYTISVGAGGSQKANGGNTTGFGITATGGKGATDIKGASGTGCGAGGRGGSVFGVNPATQESTAGGAGAYAFGDSKLRIPSFGIGYKFGAGGGGAHALNSHNCGAWSGSRAGGVSGGGDGGSYGSAGSAGTANSGGGGGGGGNNMTYTEAGGKGGSGIVIIRNVRS